MLLAAVQGRDAAGLCSGFGAPSALSLVRPAKASPSPRATRMGLPKGAFNQESACRNSDFGTRPLGPRCERAKRASVNEQFVL